MSYTRLSSTRCGFVVYSWYAAVDHLLLARRVFWQTSYHRIALGEVDSLVLSARHRERLRALIWLAICGVVACICFAFGASKAGAGLLVVGALLATLEIALGPFTAARIRTRTSLLNYPVAGRLRFASRVVSRFSSHIESAQSGLPPLPASCDISAMPPPPQLTSPEGPIVYSHRTWSVALTLSTALLALDGIIEAFHVGAVHVSRLVLLLDLLPPILFIATAACAAVVIFRHPTRAGMRAIAIIEVALYPVLVFGVMFTSFARVFDYRNFGPAAAVGYRFAVALQEVSITVKIGLALLFAGWFLIQGGHFEPAPVPAPPLNPA